MINNPIIYKFFRDLFSERVVGFSCRPFPNILKYREHQWNLPTIWKTRALQTLIEEFSILRKNVQNCSSLEPPLEYNQDHIPGFDKSRFVMIYLTILRVKEILCSFRLLLEGKTYKAIPESSRLEFLGFQQTIWLYQICRRQHLWSIEWRRLSRFSFAKNFIGNLPKVPTAKFLRSDVLFFFY